MVAKHKTQLVRHTLSLCLVATGFNSTAVAGLQGPANVEVQPAVVARSTATIERDSYEFKDLNKNQRLDPYEDWRLSVEERIDDLLAQMSLEEKVGMMLIDTLNADPGGKLPEVGLDYINNQKMTRFIFRNNVSTDPAKGGAHGRSGADLTPGEAAHYINEVQATAEATRLGIPVLFKSNARNHFTHDARYGINNSAGSFSAWPKEAGLAATRDMDLVKEFAQTMASEWHSIGLRGMYGYMADLATEPRWFRVHETFTEDADLASDIVSTLITNLQGEQVDHNSIVLTMKHFPGGGPQERGLDPHYQYGKNQVYPADMFDYHLKPFRAAVKAGMAAVMPYYGIPVGQRYQPNDVGMSFSKGIVTDLLRRELGYEGVVNSDTGIMDMTPWGLMDKTVEERLVMGIEAGTDVLSGFHTNKQIYDLVATGKLSEGRIDQSVRRLLAVQFRLGLFENPYADPEEAERVLGNPDHQEKADLAQRKSVVLLQNSNNILPLKASSDEGPIKLYTVGVNKAVAGDPQWGYQVVAGDYDVKKGESRPSVPDDTDYAVIRVVVNNTTNMPDMHKFTKPGTKSKSFDLSMIMSSMGEEELRALVTDVRVFGGAKPEHVDYLAFSEMVEKGSESWEMTPSLGDIQEVMRAVGPDNTVLAIYFRQPYVLDEASGMKNAGAILATFGVSDSAIMDVISGRFNPSGKLPFALANKAEAIVTQASDEPGYDDDDILFPFGFGLSFQ